MSTGIDAKTVIEDSNDLEDLSHSSDKTGKTGTKLSIVNEHYAEIKTRVLPARNLRGAEKVTCLGGPRPQGALHSRARIYICAAYMQSLDRPCLRNIPILMASLSQEERMIMISFLCICMSRCSKRTRHMKFRFMICLHNRNRNQFEVTSKFSTVRKLCQLVLVCV